MTWSVTLQGHDDLSGELKESFEYGLVSKVKNLVDEVKSGEGVIVTFANVTTNTTGSVDVNQSNEEATPAA